MEEAAAAPAFTPEEAAALSADQLAFLERKRKGIMPRGSTCPTCDGAGTVVCGKCDGTGINAFQASAAAARRRHKGACGGPHNKPLAHTPNILQPHWQVDQELFEGGQIIQTNGHVDVSAFFKKDWWVPRPSVPRHAQPGCI